MHWKLSPKKYLRVLEFRGSQSIQMAFLMDTCMENGLKVSELDNGFKILAQEIELAHS